MPAGLERGLLNLRAASRHKWIAQKSTDLPCVGSRDSITAATRHGRHEQRRGLVNGAECAK